MQSSFVGLPLVLILFIASLSYTNADKEVRVLSYDAHAIDEKMFGFWISDLSDGLISTEVDVRQNCPGPVKFGIKLYSEGQLVDTKKFQNVTQPMDYIKKCCSSTDAPEPDDDSCSFAQGEHTASDCDLSPFFSYMDDGQYLMECRVEIDNTVVSIATLNFTVRGT